MTSRSQGGVVFEVEGELCFLPAAIARKLLPAPRVARMPGAPASLRGVALVDGEMIPVVDLRSERPREHFREPEGESDGAMLVCSLLGESVGLVGLDVIATGFFGVGESGQPYVTGRAGRSARLLDVAAVIARVREGRWAV
jgi:hypothetical protein